MRRGRSFNPLTGNGPLVDLARELRELRWGTTREMGKAANYSHTMISDVLGSKKVPTLQFVDRYLRASGVTAPEELDRWQHKCRAAKLAAASTTFAELAAALRCLIVGYCLSDAELHQRLISAPRDAALAQDALWKPTMDELTAALGQESERLSRAMVIEIVRAVCDSEITAQAWAAQWDAIPASQPSASAAPEPAPPAARRRWPWTVTAATALLLSACLYAVYLADRRPQLAVVSSARLPACPIATSRPTSATDNAARAKLLALCTQVLRTFELPASGRYTYTHVQVWSRNDTGNADDKETLNDERVWLTGDRAGQRTVTRTVGAGSPEPPQIERYEVGTFPLSIEEPSAHAGILATQIDQVHPPALGAVGRFRAVAELYTEQWLDRAHRAAVLEVLAGTAGVRYLDRQTDQHGRIGIAFSADLKVAFQTIREILLFHPETGGLISHETVSIPDSPGVLGQTPATTARVLYLEQRQTDSLD